MLIEVGEKLVAERLVMVAEVIVALVEVRAVILPATALK